MGRKQKKTSVCDIRNNKPPPTKCKTPNTLSALKYRSAINPIKTGAIIAPHDWVEKASAISLPEALRLFPKKVPRVTNHPPHIKN